MKFLFLKIKILMKVLGLLLFTMATPFSSFAQETNDDEELDMLIDELFFNEKEFIDEILESLNTHNYIYGTVSYNNNTYFSGRDSGIDQFNIIPQVSYYHSSGFNASISGIYYSEFEPGWDLTTISVAYNNAIDKKKSLIYNVGYTRYLYHSDNGIFTNSFDLSLGIRNKKRTFGTRLATSYLFGTDQSFQFLSTTYGNFTLTRQKNMLLKFRPRLDFIVAQQTITLERLAFIDGQFRIVTREFNIFDLLNTQLSIPVSLITRSWDFELGYTLNFPNPVAVESGLKTTGFFNISVGYLIDLKKR